MLRSALAKLLNMEDDIAVVAEAAAADQVVAAARKTTPDVALLDIEMPGGNGLDVAAELATQAPACRVIMLTTFGRPGYLRRAMEAHAAGFLLKDSPADELAAAIRRVVAGERVVDPSLAAAALTEGASPLTAREDEVLRASAEHATVAEIANAVHLSAGTVRNHLSTVIGKLGARNRTDALRIAQEKGWV
jgi:two-component system response regulator DesR